MRHTSAYASHLQAAAPEQADRFVSIHFIRQHALTYAAYVSIRVSLAGRCPRANRSLCQQTLHTSDCASYVSIRIRQHTHTSAYAYVSIRIRQHTHTSAYASHLQAAAPEQTDRFDHVACADGPSSRWLQVRRVKRGGEKRRSIRQHTSAYVSIRQHTSAYVSIRQHTTAYASIRQHTPALIGLAAAGCRSKQQISATKISATKFSGTEVLETLK
jgi:hypothetical protein